MLWDLLYRAAYDLALAGCAEADAVRLLHELGGVERSGFETAKLHYLGHLTDAGADMFAERAKRYLEAALHAGDFAGRWQATGERVDPWDFARHQFGNRVVACVA
jgi:hypothetical protein